MTSEKKTLNDFILDALEREHKDILDELTEKFNKKHEVEDAIEPETESEEPSKETLLTILKQVMAEKEKIEEDLKKTSGLYNLAKIEHHDFVRKSEQKIEETRKNTLKKFAIEIVSIISTIDLAKKSCQHDYNILIGIEMLEKQFLETLKKFKIEKITIKVGDEFDEKFCEAIDKEGGGKSLTISRISSWPFVLENELIVPGRVVVFE